MAAFTVFFGFGGTMLGLNAIEELSNCRKNSSATLGNKKKGQIRDYHYWPVTFNIDD